jgi:hypothetical protein
MFPVDADMTLRFKELMIPATMYALLILLDVVATKYELT